MYCHTNSVGLTVTMSEKCFVKINYYSLVYCKDTGYVTLKILNNEEIECLRLRSGFESQELSEICLYHYHFYIKACSNRYKVCYNPLKNHNYSKSTRIKQLWKKLHSNSQKNVENYTSYQDRNCVTGVKKPLKTLVTFQKEMICMMMMKSDEKLNETLTSTDCSPLKKVWKDREV